MITAGKVTVKVRSMSDEWRLWPIGDVHLANIGCDEKRLDATLAKIADDPRASWIGMGDYADLISAADKRFDPDSVAPKDRGAYFQKLGPSMVARIADKFIPIANKCIGLLMGNHEYTHEQRYDQAIASEVCARMNASLDGKPWRVPFLGYCGFRDLVFTRGKVSKTYRICAHHGAGFAQTKGGKLNKLIQFMRQFEADIYLMGHVHNITEDIIITVGADADCEHLVNQTRVGIQTGSYLKTYPQDASGYGERKMYEPVPLGSPCIVITPGERSFSVEKPW